MLDRQSVGAALPSVGQRVAGRYIIEAELGRGGMGAVFRVIPTRLMTVEQLGLPPVLRKVVDHFGRRCRAVQLVPFDPHLEEGAEISLDRLRPDTRDALLELAVAVADGFPLSL